jgi:hypothetical protein
MKCPETGAAGEPAPEQTGPGAKPAHDFSFSQWMGLWGSNGGRGLAVLAVATPGCESPLRASLLAASLGPYALTGRSPPLARRHRFGSSRRRR